MKPPIREWECPICGRDLEIEPHDEVECECGAILELETDGDFYNERWHDTSHLHVLNEPDEEDKKMAKADMIYEMERDRRMMEGEKK
jgi:hypothetical protein